MEHRPGDAVASAALTRKERKALAERLGADTSGRVRNVGLARAKVAKLRTGRR